jgi:predicted dehydrogenase
VESDIRVGIVGAGRIGRFHLETCRETPGFDVRAACDPSDSIRKSLGTHNVALYSSTDDMLAHEELDAVFVCAPPAHHVPVASLCLEHAIPVLCEKPFGIDLVDACTLLDLSDRHRTPILLASKFRHVPAIAQARELLHQDAIGLLVHVEIEFCDYVDMAERWNSIPSQSGGGVIVDSGSHAFDILQFVAGSLHCIQATRMRQVQPFAVEDGVIVHVKTQKGVTASVTLSWSLPAVGAPLLRLRGERGEITVGWRESWLRVQGNDPVRFGAGYDKVETHHGMYQQFRQVLQRGRAAWISSEEILAVSQTIESAYASLHSERFVTLPSHHDKTMSGLAGRQ